MIEDPHRLGSLTPEDAEVVRRYLRKGRLSAIPAKRSRRMPIYRWLVSQFEPGTEYPEADVNQILSRYHHDFAFLRRELVDHRFMDRDRGLYWRIDNPS